MTPGAAAILLPMSGSGPVRVSDVAPDGELLLRFAATAQNIAPARHAVAAGARGAGLPGGLVDTIALAVSEAMTNAVVHAFLDRDNGSIEVTAGLQGDAFVVTVIDDGSGMLPRPDSPGLGLGLPIITQLAVSLDVRSDPGSGGTKVTMTFRA